MLFITRIQNMIFVKPIVKSDIESLNKIINNRCSVSRFGDGEIAIVNNKSIKFQEADERLAQKLNEVLNSNDDNMMVCIPDIFEIRSLKYLTYDSKIFWLNELVKNRKTWYHLPKKNKVYYDACITRPYIRNADKEHSRVLIGLLKQIWENRNIVIVEGIHSRLGVGNDLYFKASSIERVLCPKKDAFQKYDEILNYIIGNISKDKLVLISLGPTATVLAYDLYKHGYQAIDLGHIDLEYEWFLCNATERVLIKNKEVNELSTANDIKDCTDSNYQKQILVEIQ